MQLRQGEPAYLAWTDVQRDRFEIAPETTVADTSVIASVLVGCASDGQEAAVWVTRDQAAELHAWLEARLNETEATGV